MKKCKPTMTLWCLSYGNRDWFPMITLTGENYNVKWIAERLIQSWDGENAHLVGNKDWRLLPIGKFPRKPKREAK